jgi:hypothetical protein
MTNDAYFTGASGRRYTYAEIADRIRNEAPHTLGKHISEQLAAIGLDYEMMNGSTPCGLPFTFADYPEDLEAIDIHARLAGLRQIASIWCIEDVQSVRPGLTDDQAWEVLQAARRNHDATIGINWDVLEFHAADLFGSAPDTGEAEGE